MEATGDLFEGERYYFRNALKILRLKFRPSAQRFPQLSSPLRLRGSGPQPQLLGTRHNLCFHVHVKGRCRSGVLVPLTSVTLLFLTVAQLAERSDEVQGLQSVYVTMVTAPSQV